MSFSFDFDDEDVERGADEVVNEALQPEIEGSSEATAPKYHDLDSLLKTLPSTISYSTIRIPSYDGRSIIVPRRELFDIRAQLMAEDTSEQSGSVGLSTDDIVPDVYEGGFKTWECSIDLAAYISTFLHAGDYSYPGQHHVIEVGAGTALPTLTLFRHFLGLQKRVWTAIHISLADFNQAVLETTTVPNLILTWYFASSAVSLPAEGDLDITEDLVQRFQQDMADRVIHIAAISGAWSDSLCNLLNHSVVRQPHCSMQTLFLASETIYSPSSIPIFADMLIRILKRAENAGGRANALIAAKRVYFGVGGGVDGFLKALVNLGGRATVAWESKGSGVSRLILNVPT